MPSLLQFLCCIVIFLYNVQPDKRTLKRKVDINKSTNGSSSAADLSDQPDNSNQTMKRKVNIKSSESTSSGSSSAVDLSDQSGDTVSVIDEDSSSNGDSSKEIGLIFFILCLSCFVFISSCVCFSWVWLSLIMVL